MYFRSIVPEDPGKFSKFEKQKSKNQTKKNPQLGMRFPHKNMSAAEVLGLDKNLSKDSIQSAFRKKIQEFHPDRFENATEEERKLASESTILVKQARDDLMKRLGS